MLGTAVAAGIIGANGAGKSTLFKMLMGKEQPDSGSLKLGETVKTMYVDQSRESLSSDRSAAAAAAAAAVAQFWVHLMRQPVLTPPRHIRLNRVLL